MTEDKEIGPSEFRGVARREESSKEALEAQKPVASEIFRVNVDLRSQQCSPETTQGGKTQCEKRYFAEEPTKWTALDTRKPGRLRLHRYSYRAAKMELDWTFGYNNSNFLRTPR
jgi:hypothetical protein